jgi:hypothetical protein
MIYNCPFLGGALNQCKEHPYGRYKGQCNCSGTNYGHGALATKPFAKQPDYKKSYEREERYQIKMFGHNNR